MHYQQESLRAEDGGVLRLHSWLPDGEPLRVLQVSHGMAEHAGRYHPLAAAMTAVGTAVYVLDQRGHGYSAGPRGHGHLADQRGWDLLLADQLQVNRLIHLRHPCVPVVLIGHDIGSVVVQCYLLAYSCSVTAAVLSGTNYQPRWLCHLGHLIARMECWRLGPLGRSALIEWLSFGSFNRSFRPNRTRCDWLSRDAAAVDAYLADPLCGFRCSNQLWCDLCEGLERINPPQKLASIDTSLPVLILGGSHDPVSCGHRLRHLRDALLKAGMRHVELHLYPEARHDLFQESNREEIFADLRCWLEQLPPQQPFCPL